MFVVTLVHGHGVCGYIGTWTWCLWLHWYKEDMVFVVTLVHGHGVCSYIKKEFLKLKKILCWFCNIQCSMFYVQCSRCCLLLILLNGVFMSRWNFDVVLKQCCYCVSISATDFTCLFLVLDSALFVRQLIPFVCVCVCVCASLVG